MIRHLLSRACILAGLTAAMLGVRGTGETARAAAPEKPVITVGSKSFTESYILAEILAQTIERAGEAAVRRRFGMGGTGIVFAALETGEVDLYPEYSGTISNAILKDESLKDLKSLRRALQPSGLILSESLGFNNTYALALTRGRAEQLDLESISDLRSHPELNAAFSYEFMKRADGYPALVQAYGLKFARTDAMEHSLAYEAIASSKVDLLEVYSTDAKIRKFDLKVLEDDRGFFPDYFGVILARQDLLKRFPRTWAALSELEGAIDEQKMIELNALAELDGKSFSEAASAFLGTQPVASGSRKWSRLLRLTREHLFLVFVSLLAAITVGVPLGITAAKYRTLGQGVLVLSGLLQTIPSLALLCFLIPLLGIGTAPSLFALFLYGLLPIVRNTYSGLISLDSRLVETGRVLGLSPGQRLRLIELPLASINILAGVKTSAVINVGTATLAALIGAGGYGTLIVTGLALNDVSIILQGAVPAAVMALGVHGLFEGVDRVLIPKGLRR